MFNSDKIKIKNYKYKESKNFSIFSHQWVGCTMEFFIFQINFQISNLNFKFQFSNFTFLYFNFLSTFSTFPKKEVKNKVVAGNFFYKFVFDDFLKIKKNHGRFHKVHFSNFIFQISNFKFEFQISN